MKKNKTGAHFWSEITGLHEERFLIAKFLRAFQLRHRMDVNVVIRRCMRLPTFLWS